MEILEGKLKEQKLNIILGSSIVLYKPFQVDFWLTATSGKYAVQDDTVDPRNLCGFLFADKEGTFSFNAIKPTPYKVLDNTNTIYTVFVFLFRSLKMVLVEI